MIHSILIAALVAGQAAAAPPRCLTRQEAGDIALNAAAIGLSVLAERCRPHVGPTAFLNTGAQAMLTRLREAAEPRRNSAFVAFARMSQPAPGADDDATAEAGEGDSAARNGADAPDVETGEMPQFDPAANPELMSGLVMVMAATMINSVDTAACADADDLFEALSPLPPENIARIAGAGLGIAGTARPGAADSPLCPA